MHFLWLDLETTGLDYENDYILEVSSIITNEKLEEISTFSKVIKYEKEKVWLKMNEFCRTMHTKNELINEVENGEELPRVEELLIGFILEHFNRKDKIFLCGNSVDFDRTFIKYHMKHLFNLIHYQVLDVTSLQLLFNTMCNKKVFLGKQYYHRGLPDLRESIRELKFYLNFIKEGMINGIIL